MFLQVRASRVTVPRAKNHARWVILDKRASLPYRKYTKKTKTQAIYTLLQMILTVRVNHSGYSKGKKLPENRQEWYISLGRDRPDDPN